LALVEAASGNNWPTPQAVGDIDAASYFTQLSGSNRDVDPGLSINAFNLLPTAGVAALTGAATPPNDGFFLRPLGDLRGRVGTVDWDDPLDVVRAELKLISARSRRPSLSACSRSPAEFDDRASEARCVTASISAA